MNPASGKINEINPLILSAGRATDIPAFYSDWLFGRFEKGYLIKTNPFNNRPYKIILSDVKFIVFWTKNPKPIIKNLPFFDSCGIRYYFQYTLNDYEREGYEKNLPPLSERIATFKELSDKIGKEKVVWRFDPLILSGDITVDTLLERIEKTGDEIAEYTERMVFSFIDLYRSVKQNLVKSGFSDVREFEADEKRYFADGLLELNKSWNLGLFSCAEEMPPGIYGIKNGRCIDPLLIKRICADDPEFVSYVEKNSKKDKNQRKLCGCMPATDVGQYNTCIHMCSYCYANKNQGLAAQNYRMYRKNPDSDSIAPFSFW